jgi:hypothetical protein
MSNWGEKQSSIGPKNNLPYRYLQRGSSGVVWEMIILLSVDDEDDNDKENGWRDYLNVDGNDMILWKSSESIW